MGGKRGEQRLRSECIPTQLCTGSCVMPLHSTLAFASFAAQHFRLHFQLFPLLVAFIALPHDALPAFTAVAATDSLSSAEATNRASYCTHATIYIYICILRERRRSQSSELLL
ncbi:unnamed protein product [Ceratitis capitata]|uniref:(Mediterranean fruit fly) hypothetical protein n=1 Tax=Ceratitis capitata TaxID=7213 RepID=A0A811UM07_CERCA|nr:unnamed protein product [Ceratitis capitata]